ncbi:hypothetical protein LAY50_00010 [Escherichia coli]|nr:hypothetical protein [Escherichia coli]
MKNATILVLYNPNIKYVSNNINIISELTDSLILIDNTPEHEKREINKKILLQSISGFDEVYYIGMNNEGLSKAYNEGVKKLNSCCHKIGGVLFLDQDSDVSHATLKQLWDTYNKLEDICDLGVLGAYPIRVDGIGYRYNVKKENTNILPTNVIEVKRVISSFSIVPLRVLNELNGFYDDFFIDHIDNDFSRRCIKKNKIVAMDLNAKFIQRIGEGSITFLGKHITPISAPFRHYYQARNILLSAKRCGDGIIYALPYLVKRFIMINLQGVYGHNLITRYKFYLLGILHGINNRSGKLK